MAQSNRSASAVIAAIAVVLGGGTAALAMNAAANSNAPDDTAAVSTGPTATANPTDLITYGK